MGSPCEVLLESTTEAAAVAGCDAVAAEAWRIEDKYSRYVADNVIHRINNAAGVPVEVDEETARLLDFAATLHELSEGLFDVTSGVLRAVWNFDGGGAVPDEEAVAAVRSMVGWSRVQWVNPSLTLEPGMELDLGGIGKEYAVDRCTERLRQISDAPALVNFGGDLAVTGPRKGGEPWKVAVESESTGVPGKLIELRQGAIATSGDARRFVEYEGRRYGHILNPLTGWPVDNAPRSVTVAADTCTQAGMLSTLGMLRGSGAEEFLEAQGVRYWCRL
ncbi:MAG TPA: FAD:protein FMN transferase [Woeseiaceae bacterium]|jgi:thiamine biosynthesis lipoprotein|nr:FAD:protein FMN transferase [Woeseiaceae bacterium]